MSLGNLLVTAVTVRGLADNGIHNVHAFLGCYIVASDKHRTQTQQGPEPQWNQTLTVPIPEGNTTLYLEVVNESLSDSGVIGHGKADLTGVLYQNQGQDEVWVPIHSTSTNGVVGHALLRLEKQHQQTAAAPPPPAYSGSYAQNEYPKEKQQPPPPFVSQSDRQSSFASLGPEQPLPANYGTGNPPPFTPPASSANQPPQYPVGSQSQYPVGSQSQYPVGSQSQYPVSPSYQQHLQKQNSSGSFQMPGTPTTPQPEGDQKAPDWKKIGGIALGAAGAIGITAFAAHEYKEHQEEKHQHHKH